MRYFFIAFVAAFCVISSQQQSCFIKQNKDIDLPDLAAKSGQPQSNCCSICRRTPKCKGFAWNAHKNGTCWLKAGSKPLITKAGVNAGIVKGGIKSGKNKALITFEEFTKGVMKSNGYPRPTRTQYKAFIQGLPKGHITTKQEAAMALTHFLHESDGLRAKREYKCQGTGCPGEYGTPSCDVTGQNYYGRGYIQLTWCYNYRAASMDLYKDNRMVDDPDSVARSEKLAWNTDFWFWKVHVHNAVGVAQGDFGVTTKAINGGIECSNTAGHPVAKLRYKMYRRIRSAFGLRGPGREKGCYN